MANFLKLVQNENMKIYRRVRTWVMLGIIVLLPILVSTLFYIANQSDTRGKTTAFEAMQIDSSLMFFLVMIFSVVIAAESVAGEFTRGTIKLLLIRPWSRSSILLSKFVSVVLFSVLLTLLTYALSFTVNYAYFGATNAVDSVIPELNAGAGTMFSELGQLIWTNYISTLVVIAIAFMLSSALRSNGLAIGLSMAIIFTSDLWTHLFLMIDQPWIKYVLFLHLNLQDYVNGHTGPISEHPMTLGFALGVLAVYFIIFNLISWTVFRKRDITA